MKKHIPSPSWILVLERRSCSTNRSRLTTRFNLYAFVCQSMPSRFTHRDSPSNQRMNGKPQLREWTEKMALKRFLRFRFWTVR